MLCIPRPGRPDLPLQETEAPKLKNIGPEPKRFTVADGQLLTVSEHERIQPATASPCHTPRALTRTRCAGCCATPGTCLTATQHATPTGARATNALHTAHAAQTCMTPPYPHTRISSPSPP